MDRLKTAIKWAKNVNERLCKAINKIKSYNKEKFWFYCYEEILSKRFPVRVIFFGVKKFTKKYKGISFAEFIEFAYQGALSENENEWVVCHKLIKSGITPQLVFYIINKSRPIKIKLEDFNLKLLATEIDISADEKIANINEKGKESSKNKNIKKPTNLKHLRS
jgi:hypothetical protein